MINRLKAWSLFDWQCACFALAVFLVPFHATHKAMILGFLGDMGGKLSIYPILIGLMIYAYQCIKNKTTYIPRKYIIFVFIVFLWQLISTIHGLFIFPKWDEAGVDQFDKLIKIVSILSAKGITVDTSFLGKIWLSSKLIIREVPEIICTYGVSLWGISLFVRNYKIASKFFLYGILASASMCAIYSVVELAYLFDMHWAMILLAHLNPMFYDVASAHGWWPPLFSTGRVRSMFAEPAYMAVYLSVAIPCVVYQFLNAKNFRWIWGSLIAMLLIMMIATNSKTAMGILTVEAVLGIFFLLLHRNFITKGKIYPIIVLMVMAISIGSGVRYLMIHHYSIDYDVISIDENNSVKLKITNTGWSVWKQENGYGLTASWYNKDWQGVNEVTERFNKTVAPGDSLELRLDLGTSPNNDIYPYVVVELEEKNAYLKRRLSNNGAEKLTFAIQDNKLISLGEAKQRNNYSMTNLSASNGSNQQRYGMMLIDAKIGLDYPIFGVGGTDLKQGYIVERIPNNLLNNREVKLWINTQKEKGLWRSGFPVISEYPNQLATYGFVGLFLFLLPSVYMLALLWTKRSIWLSSYNKVYQDIAVLFTAFAGLMISFIGGTAVQLYIYWLLLGVIIGWCEVNLNDSQAKIEN